MREKRGKLKFEDVTRDPTSNPTTPEVETETSGAKPKQRQKYEGDEPKTEDAAASGDSRSAYDNASARAADNAPTNTPVSEIPTVGADGSISNHLMGLQHGTAQTIRNLMPGETPDRNAGVSAARFGMEVAATVVGIARDPKKMKPKSKLKHSKDRLKFDEGESKESAENAEQRRSDGEQPENDGNIGDGDSTNDNRDNSDSQDNGKSEQSGGEADGGTASDKKPETQNDGTADNNDSDDSTPKPPPKDSTAQSADGASDSASGAPSDKPNSRLQFSNEEKQIEKLEKKADKYGIKLDKARDKLPTKLVEKQQLVFDEDKKKTVSKLTHVKEVIPIGEAKWNQPKQQSAAGKVAGAATSMAVTKIHAKVHQVEHENVGVKAAHKAELIGESAYRGAKSRARSAYRFHKNRPYRRVAKLEKKSIKNKMKLDYKKALRDNPKLKSNPLSRFMQKRTIKRNYAKDLRAAKNAAHTGKKAVGITAKAAKVVTAIIRKNPVFLIKLVIIGLMFFLIMSLFTMCAAMFSGTSAFIGAVTYPAEAEDIDAASVLMTELETDLRIYINEIEENHPDFDEYIFDIGAIGHNPFELIAFLSAVFHDFTFAEVEDTIRAIFDAMYTLELEEEIEVRQSWEQVGEDYYGNPIYDYVDNDWHILHVTLTSVPMSEVIADMMDEEQTQHFLILMQSYGARQFIGNPFAFDWMPFVTSHYGYRIHPISGGKQFHWGIDIGLPLGTEILATFDGVVVYAGYHPTGYGNIVVIENEDGVQARFAHCHEIFVVLGQEVEQGDVIATVGSTEASTGPHLHLEVAWDGRRFNPLFFVEFRV